MKERERGESRECVRGLLSSLTKLRMTGAKKANEEKNQTWGILRSKLMERENEATAYEGTAGSQAFAPLSQ